MGSQELNIEMDEEHIRNLIMGYIKDSHHDFFQNTAVFKDIWSRIEDHTRKRKRTGGGQSGGEEDTDIVPPPSFIAPPQGEYTHQQQEWQQSDAPEVGVPPPEPGLQSEASLDELSVQEPEVAVPPPEHELKPEASLEERPVQEPEVAVPPPEPGLQSEASHEELPVQEPEVADSPPHEGVQSANRAIFTNVIISAGLAQELETEQKLLSSNKDNYYNDLVMDNIPEKIDDDFTEELKIKLILKYDSLFGGKETDFALGYITEDDLYEEQEPEPDGEPELTDLIEWTTKIDEETTLKVLLDNNFLSPEPVPVAAPIVEPVDPEMLDIGDGWFQVKEYGGRGAMFYLDGVTGDSQWEEPPPPPPVNRGGGSSQIGGSLGIRRGGRIRVTVPTVAKRVREFQGELKKIHKMISVWDGLIKRMREAVDDGEDLFHNLKLANAAQDQVNQLRSSFQEVQISSKDVYNELMGDPPPAAADADVAAAAERFNRKIEEILNETPNAETENKLKKINQLFNSFNKYAIGGGKGKLTTPGDDIFNKFISKKWTSTAGAAAGAAGAATGAAEAVIFVFKKLFNKKSRGIELIPDEKNTIDKFQVLIMKHGWFDKLGAVPPPNLPQWLNNFRERVMAGSLDEPKMENISDNRFSKEFSENEYNIDFTTTGVWELTPHAAAAAAEAPGPGPVGASLPFVKQPEPTDPERKGPDDLISIINNSKLANNSGDNASPRKLYKNARPETIKIFTGEGEDANCNAPNVADPGPNCQNLEGDIDMNKIEIKVHSGVSSRNNYSVSYVLDHIKGAPGSRPTKNLSNCTMTVIIRYNGDTLFNINEAPVSNKKLSKPVVLTEMISKCKDILSEHPDADAPNENDYHGILSKLVELYHTAPHTVNLKPIVDICLGKLFGDHGQELFAVGMLVDDDNRPDCSFATLAGNDRISHCRLLHMLKYARNANNGKGWAAIFNSTSGYNMIYKCATADEVDMDVDGNTAHKKKTKRNKNKSKRSKKKTKRNKNKSKRSKKKTKRSKKKSINKIQYIYNFFK